MHAVRRVGCLSYWKAKGKWVSYHVIFDKLFSLLSLQKCSVTSRFTTQPHYRLCLGDVPFVAGKVGELLISKASRLVAAALVSGFGLVHS